MPDRAAASLADEPLRISALLRLPLVALIALLVTLTHTKHWLDATFAAVLATYAATALAWLYIVLRGPVRAWYGWASTAADLVFVVLLCIVSGGATVWLMPIFFLLPISVVFLHSPAVTATVGLSAAAGYLMAWFVYAVRDEMVEIPPVAYVQTGCLLWLAAALTGLSFTLRRRSNSVATLLDVRRHLVAEAMKADARRSRELSELLHDGPLQNLLAARLDLDDIRATPTAEGFDRLESALRCSVTDLRTLVTTLHPQVLAQMGLSAAVRDLCAKHQLRWGTTVRTDIEEAGRPDSQAMVFRAVRELLNNAHKHARAQQIFVSLRRDADTVHLTVSDDGVGFAPDVLASRVAEGHIGLTSLIVGVEAMGGILDIDSAAGRGTTVTVVLPGALTTGTPDPQTPSPTPEHRPAEQVPRHRGLTPVR